MAESDALLEAFVRLRAKAAEGFEGEARESVLPGLKRVAEDAAGVVAATKIWSFGKEGLDELKDSLAVAAQTTAAIQSTGGAANVTAEQVGDLAGKLSDLSGKDDELIQKGENLLLTFKGVKDQVGEGNDIFDRATAAALDLSVSGFGSMESASLQLGKALNDPVAGMSALSRSGVTFTDQQKETIKSLVESGKQLEAQKIILGEVESQVGGAAKAYGETLPGELERAHTAIDNAKAALVSGLAPALETGAGLATSLATGFQELPEPLQEAIGALGLVGGGLVSLARPASDVLNLVRSLRTAHEAAATAATAEAVATESLAVAEGEAAVASKGLVATLGPLAAVAAAVVAVHEASDALGGRWAPQGELAKHILRMDGDFSHLGDEIRNAIPPVLDLTEKTGLQRQVIEDNTTQIDLSRDAYDKAAAAIRGVTDAFAKNYDELTSSLDLESKHEQAIDELTAAIAENGHTLDIHTQKGRDNVRAAEETAKSIVGLVQRRYEETHSLSDAQAAGAMYVQQLRDQLAQAGLTEEQVQSYIDTLHLTPTDLTTVISADTTPARQALDAFLDSVRSSSGMVSIGGSALAREAKATGGSYSGDSIHAAEFGTELLLLNKGSGDYNVPPGGVVIPAPQTAQILAGAGGANEEHFHVHITAPSTDAKAILRQASVVHRRRSIMAGR